MSQSCQKAGNQAGDVSICPAAFSLHQTVGAGSSAGPVLSLHLPFLCSPFTVCCEQMNMQPSNTNMLQQISVCGYLMCVFSAAAIRAAKNQRQQNRPRLRPQRRLILDQWEPLFVFCFLHCKAFILKGTFVLKNLLIGWKRLLLNKDVLLPRNHPPVHCDFKTVNIIICFKWGFSSNFGSQDHSRTKLKNSESLSWLVCRCERGCGDVGTSSQQPHCLTRTVTTTGGPELLNKLMSAPSSNYSRFSALLQKKEVNFAAVTKDEAGIDIWKWSQSSDCSKCTAQIKRARNAQQMNEWRQSLGRGQRKVILKARH